MVRHGFTLPELLLALLISTLTAGLALPGFSSMIRQHQSAAVVNGLIGNVRFARHAAINMRSRVTLCPGSPSGCFSSNQWHRGAIIFLDDNADGRLQSSEVIIKRIAPMASDGRILWRSFRNRTYLQFAANGLSIWQSGHFLYCPADGDARYARQIILNARGRSRLARDTDGDGIAEDAQGRALTC
ncbi:MAG: GspH/FimT family pseudopilin [Proteobacteria bacterium]|nr:GspH/FimT family pseudopilin [Pseudomonadota bacterium]